MYAKVFSLHSKLLKALAHPKRLEIVHLIREQELSVGQIQEMLGLPQANISQQLMLLKDEGVVSQRKAGKQVYYSLAHPNFIKASDLMRDVLIERYKNDEHVDELRMKMKDLVPLVADSICGMRLSPKTASYAYKYKEKMYYFCAEGCLKKFKLRVIPTFQSESRLKRSERREELRVNL